MERDALRVAGLGFRKAATTGSLRAALNAAGGPGVGALATLAEKSVTPALLHLAQELGIPIIPVSAAALAGQETLTQSSRLQARLCTGSLAEAAALAAAGPGSRLLGPRSIAPDGMATAAIAEKSSS